MLGRQVVAIIPGKPRHLSVVKDAPGVTGARVLAPEALTPEQRRVADQILAVARGAGVFVGALVSATPWDVRPLLLERGITLMVRVTESGLDESRREGYREALRRLESGGLIVGHGDCHTSTGLHLWQRRRYWPETLAGMIEQGLALPLHPVLMARRIAAAVADLHLRGLVHGHLVPANLAFEGDRPVLLDIASATHGLLHRQARDLAPEILTGAEPGVPSDVYGLGICLKHLLAANLTPEYAAFIEAMLIPDPRARPEMGRVADFFGGERVAPTVRPVTGAPPSGLPSGRLIQPRAAPPPAPPAPVVHPTAPPAATTSAPPPSAGVPSPVPSAFNSGPLLGFVALFALLVVGWALDVPGRIFDRAPVPYSLYWGSSDQASLEEVARAALRGDTEAELVIVQDALKGGKREGVAMGLLRSGYNPLWSSELSGHDREILLSLALASLLGQAPDVPDLTEAHPAVALAIAAELAVSTPVPPLEEISTASVARLPPPYGATFKELQRLNAATLGDPFARAVSHLLTGDGSEPVLGAIFPEDLGDAAVLGRLRLILPLTPRVQRLDQLVFATLRQRGGAFEERMRWFGEEELAGWSQVGVRDRMLIISGLQPITPLGPTQYGDLLRFPLAEVRAIAVRALERETPEHLAPLVPVMAGESVTLNRSQSIALALALTARGEAAREFIGDWFLTQPEPEAVLALLLAAGASEGMDEFSAAAVHYLEPLEWSFTLDQMEELTQHGAPLARALAYTRLDPRDTAQRRILEAGAAREPRPRLREQVLQKIAELTGGP